MFTSPHKSKSIDSIVKGFTDQEVLIGALSGKLDSRIKELGSVLTQIKTHEDSIHSVEKANKLIIDAENKWKQATQNLQDAEQTKKETDAESENIIAQAQERAKLIVNKEVDARTAASEEAKRIINEASQKAAEIRNAASDDLAGVDEEIAEKKARLATITVELREELSRLGRVRVALGDTARITNI